MVKKYKAKVSYGMLVIIFLLFFIPVTFGVISNGINKEFYIITGILVPSYSFILFLFFKTNYSVENNTLIIKCGFLFKKNIDINTIKTIKKTTSLLSSPAPSFDRIEIKYGKYDEIIISPRNKITFVKDLTSINPNIEIDISAD
ncbi:PH domain-containing protein [Aquimarina sp. 2201CG5-10]|uniref:PH domain-containing protein n=1 Tax=Aquimarina callyspongiae TaxID=3098150 RepID=UPI002AB4787E|nr:PH domain-containing protein [Aquimarina sp. 2201CG5-10]MDY8135377.1 PH domain-containing protein [Aquimarina sp. 2201CG5-10]